MYMFLCKLLCKRYAVDESVVSSCPNCESEIATTPSGLSSGSLCAGVVLFLEGVDVVVCRWAVAGGGSSENWLESK